MSPIALCAGLRSEMVCLQRFFCMVNLLTVRPQHADHVTNRVCTVEDIGH